MRNVHVQLVPSREETNRQINLKVLERPGRTSAVTTYFLALIGDGRQPAGMERRVHPQTLGFVLHTFYCLFLSARQEAGARQINAIKAVGFFSPS